MPPFHCDLAYVRRGTSRSGAVGYYHYLHRHPEADARRYRDHEGREDIREHGDGNLPAWAGGNAALFWEAAEVFERKGGVVHWQYTVTLPRELPAQARLALADDLRQVVVGTHYAHSWGLHEARATDGSGVHPHLHVMFSPRRQEPGRELDLETWFRQAPLGLAKDARWFDKPHLYALRAGTATLINASLEREGYTAQAVDHRTLARQGLERVPARYCQRRDAEERGLMLAERQTLMANGTRELEEQVRVAAWHDHKQRESLTDLSREGVVAHVRRQFWAQDTRLARDIARAVAWDQAREQERLPRERVSPPRAHPPRGRQGLLVHEDAVGTGVQIQLREEERGWQR